MENQAEILTLEKTAAVLGISEQDTLEMVRSGYLAAIPLGEKMFITARSVRALVGLEAPERAVLPTLQYTSATFSEYAVKVLNDGIKRAGSRSIENYRYALSVAAGALGEVPIANITLRDLRKAFDVLAPKYSKRSLERAWAITRVVLQIAYEEGDIPSDPSSKWKKPKSSKPRMRGDAPIYTDADIAMLFRTSRAFNQELYTMFAVLECTGMRPGEMLALEWQSFDEEKKSIHIYQAVTRAYDAVAELGKAPSSRSVISVPKSEYSVRTLKLSATAVEALRQWREKQLTKRGAIGRFIFEGRDGGFRSLSGCEGLLQRYRKACGLNGKGITLYKFRHTMCTRLVLDRQPIPVIQRILGDNTPDVVMRFYTHVDASAAQESTRRFYSALDRTHSAALVEEGHLTQRRENAM